MLKVIARVTTCRTGCEGEFHRARWSLFVVWVEVVDEFSYFGVDALFDLLQYATDFLCLRAEDWDESDAAVGLLLEYAIRYDGMEMEVAV